MRLVPVDLADGLDTLLDTTADGPDVFAPLWWRSLPIGHVELDARTLADRRGVERAVADATWPAVAHHTLPGGFPAAPPLPGARPPVTPPAGFQDWSPDPARLAPLAGAPALHPPAWPLDVSVVVCTRERPEQLARCLASLSRGTVAPDEIIVVDNAPASGATRDVVAAATGPGVRWVPEPRRGLSHARNTGVSAASGATIAFTDDDTEVHPDWLWRIVRPLEDPAVWSATGLVLPADLSSPAQVLFEKGFGGFSQGYRPITFDSRFVTAWRGRAVPVWQVGAGANMAVRRSAFERVGLFDERLGAGATGCSEDSELWLRILMAGGVCRYEPTAVVHHHHRADIAGLRRLAHDYVRGHVAALLVEYARHHRIGELRRAYLEMPRHIATDLARRVTSGDASPWGMSRPGLTGYLRGAARVDLAVRRRRAPAVGRAITEPAPRSARA